MSSEEIQEELNRRITNGLSGFHYGDIAHKILKIILNQAFIDGLLAFAPIDGKPLILSGSIREISIFIDINQ